MIGYVVYWFGDSLDGWVARYRNEETVSGAVFDIVCDRACSFLLAAAFMATYPETIGPLAIYLVQFGVLDTMLTLSFLLWQGHAQPELLLQGRPADLSSGTGRSRPRRSTRARS